ncbi:hypothetical protein IscW_ISCW006458 [Ixodes scapularis]|uniref:Uncharacterized protein n=1 Tax=Ixodes scapularis TaxID=6945 RepID=B7PMB6_IXOSC|nr:hypothetical protein IscW_ISCW006458 [Ixodes scapularis]|eukprot:XP_002434914.1 hypothetical protein IscW_ISCW006458 [Ixodes scapularis]
MFSQLDAQPALVATSLFGFAPQIHHSKVPNFLNSLFPRKRRFGPYATEFKEHTAVYDGTRETKEKKLKPTTNARNWAYKKYSAVLNTSGWGWQSPRLPRGEAQDENTLKMQTSVQQWDSALRVARAFMRRAVATDTAYCVILVP